MNKNKCLRKAFLEYACPFLAVMAFIWYISTFHFQMMLIQGDSMLPAYHNLQLVVLQKNVETYGRGEVVAFRCDGLDAVLVKRIAALPGETVQIQDGILYVNDEICCLYSEDTVFDYAGIAQEQLTLADGEYFMIGDNVSESRDSRYEKVGVVKADNILGRVI